jgi:hypothetical protein
MKTWFEATISAKKRRRRSLMLKVALIVLGVFVSILVADHLKVLPEVTSDNTKLGPRLYVAKSHAPISSFISGNQITTNSHSEQRSVKQSSSDEQALTLREIRMHNILRGLGARERAIGGSTLSNEIRKTSGNHNESRSSSASIAHEAAHEAQPLSKSTD